MRTEQQYSAGGLVVRDGKVLLIASRRGGRWQLPKGRVEAGETLEQTAVREVREETGVSGRPVAPLPSVEYHFTRRGVRRIHKRVDFFLLAYVAGDPADHSSTEVASAAWFAWEEALARLDHANERRVVAAARKLVEGTPGAI